MVQFFCPTREQVRDQIIALLPLGRAWQTRENGPQGGQTAGFDPGGFFEAGYQTETKPASVMRQFFEAISEPFYFIHQRLCALRLEFWCATQTETNDLWMVEYGLPDPCDPFPDLCTKVSAIGDARCAYYIEIAARSGWAIACQTDIKECGTVIGSRASMAGRATPGKRRTSIIRIVVYVDQSSAYSGVGRQRAMAGRLQAGRSLACGPDLGPLLCVLERVVHAEIEIKYEVVHNG